MSPPGETAPRRSTAADREALATAIAETLVDRAVPVDEGGVTWTTAVDGRTLPIGPGLYGGTAGVALFLAAWARCDGGASARQAARRAWAPLLRSAASWRRSPALRTAPLGMGRGPCSVAYAMAVAAELLDDDAMCRDAVRLFSSIPPATIESSDRLDVLGGIAGVVLCGLALETIARRRGVEAAGCRTRVDRAGRRLCADAAPLPELASVAGEPAVGWAPRPGARIVSGMAHGTAGIVMALSRWATRTESDNDADAGAEAEAEATIRAGLAMERATFSTGHGNWLDLRVDHERAMTMWCHGGPGIALARLSMLVDVDFDGDDGDSDDGKLVDEIDAGLAVAIEAPIDQGADHYCCGHLGRADVLLEAGRRLDRPEAIHQASDRLDRVARRWRDGTAHLGAGDSGPRSDPGFFLGIAGLGYALLRRDRADRLPSIGAFDVARSP